MNSDEITACFNKLNIPINPVICKDQKILYNNKCSVINMQNSTDGNGTHWVGLYKGNYIDPFGLPPPKEIKCKKFNKFKLQDNLSHLCGEFTICALYHLYNGIQINDIHNFFDTKSINRLDNNIVIDKFFIKKKLIENKEMKQDIKFAKLKK